jgi:uncharacterized protein YacL
MSVASKIMLEIQNRLGLFFFFLWVLIMSKLVASDVDAVMSFINVLFTPVSALLGIVAVKDVLKRWRERQDKIEHSLNEQIKSSIGKESALTSAKSKKKECEKRIPLYEDLLNINNNSYVISIIFALLVLLVSVLLNLLVSPTSKIPFTQIESYQLVFTLAWVGLYFFVKHILILYAVLLHD